MKLQNMIIIFILIFLPIILVVSYFMQIQIDTIAEQTSYNTKLISAANSAIQSFEINTVEWNSQYSSIADSKRRDVLASVNTFTTSLANNLNLSGTTRENMLSYIPAIAFTLYDGVYIYTSTEVHETIKDENGIDIVYSEEIECNPNGEAPNEGDLLYIANPNIANSNIANPNERTGKITVNETTYDYTTNPNNAKTTYKYMLKPYVKYSERITTEDKKFDFVIEYSLDNYVKVKGLVNGNYVEKSGYLNIRDGRRSYGAETLDEYIMVKYKVEDLARKLNEGKTLTYNSIEVVDGDTIDLLKENLKQESEEETEEEKIEYPQKWTRYSLNYYKYSSEEEKWYKLEPQYFIQKYNYVYDIDNVKTYVDEEKNFFTVNSNGEIVYLNNVENGTEAQYKYKYINLYHVVGLNRR